MLFNSFEFLFIFLPLTLLVYFLLNKQKLTTVSKAWLVLCSLGFYSWWNIKYLPLILASIIFNFSIGRYLSIADNSNKTFVDKQIALIAGIVCNIFLLGYYKYTDFFITNINNLTHFDFSLQKIILPLGISFFTFTQIAYLVDAYKGTVKEMDGLNYCLFVTFFPHLLAGPILHHTEMMPQFNSIKNKVFNNKNISIGLFLLSIGLFKKVIVADSIAVWANNGYNSVAHLNSIEAWITSLSYTFQLYFDFSGYTDMALGVSKMFNIDLPINFNSPYKAISIQDFWRRWHMTLSRFLRDYIYIPLGGNRKSELVTYRNLFLTFLIGGFWHGAGWTYILWGAIHGIALIIHRLWEKLGIKLNSILCWLITFIFINASWVVFRAKTVKDVIIMFKKMFFSFDLSIFTTLEKNISSLLILFVLILAVYFKKNSNQLAEKFEPNYITATASALIMIIAIVNLNKITEFLYFQF